MDPTLRQLMRYRKPQNVRQLFLDNQRIPTIELLCYEPASSSSNTADAYSPLPRFVNLLSLSLTGVHCTSLRNFPELLGLRRLALADNRIADGLEALAHSLPALDYLDLSNNRISTFEALLPLRHLNNLKHLCLLECEITKLPNYRQQIFEMLPVLCTLDGEDRDGKEVDSDDDSNDEEEDEEEFETGSSEEEEDDEEEEEEEEDGESYQASGVDIETILSRIHNGVYVNSDGEEVEVDETALRNIIANQQKAGLFMNDEDDDEDDEDYVANNGSADEDIQASLSEEYQFEDSNSEGEEDNEESSVKSTQGSDTKQEEEQNNDSADETIESDEEDQDEIDEELSLEEEDTDENNSDEDVSEGSESEGPGLAYLLQTPSNSENEDEEDDSGWSPTKRKHETLGELFGDDADSNASAVLQEVENNTDHVNDNGKTKSKKQRH